MNFAKCRGERRAGESSACLRQESSFLLVWHLPWDAERNRLWVLKKSLRAPSTAPNVLPIFRKATAIAAPQGSHSTMAAAMLATAPMPISGPANAVVRARKKRNAPVEHSVILPSTWMSLPGNGHASWPTRHSSRTHSGKERRWKHCSRNSRIRSDCAGSACGD